MVVSDSAVHFEQALAHARLEEKHRVQDFNVMQAALADFKFLSSRLLT